MSEQSVSKSDQEYLLKLARQTVEDYATTRKMPKSVEDAGLDEALKSRRGAFVTLHKRGSLRGCIGTFEGEGRLVDTVQRMAVSAGWQDPRFPHVEAGEIQDLDIEISVLSPLRKIKDVSEIEVGKHGIFITKGFNRGVLLPQVATEYGWDRETFLRHTCLKANLPPDAWKGNVTIEIFSADVFGEKEDT